MLKEIKKCKDCGIEKSLTDFNSRTYLNKKVNKEYTNFYSYCKPCMKTRNNDWRTTEAAKNFHRSWRLTEKGQACENRNYGKQKMRPDFLEKKRISVDAYRKRSPEKYKAQYTAYNAFRSGKINKTSCEMCGSEAKHMHHDDYSRPLDVTWLCVKCHGTSHRKEVVNLTTINIL